MILIVVNTALFVPAILWELNNFGFLFTVATNAVLRVLWMEASARKTALYYRLSSKLFLVGRYFLFGLIGVAVDLRSSDASVLRLVVAVVITGMIFRGFTAHMLVARLLLANGPLPRELVTARGLVIMAGEDACFFRQGQNLVDRMPELAR